MGVPEHLVHLMQSLYTDQEACVRTERGDNDWFSIGNGVRQGCILSPYLFNMYAEYIMREALNGYEGGIRIGGRTINNLRYADDTTLVAEIEGALKELLERVRVEREKRGLKLNVKKTKLMTTGKLDGLYIGEDKVEEVEGFVFLGANISSDG